jgi:NAD(P)-dependent dehydrogenase (short-subunit alcohol dehydrogenase family)
MDPLILAAAGRAVVKALATDGWQQARAALVRLWRHEDPEQVSAVDEEIQATRESALAAMDLDDDEAERRLAAQWHRRFSALASRAPWVGDEIEATLNKYLRPLLSSPDQEGITTIQQTIVAGRDAYVAGRDQTLFRGQTINDR